MFNDMNIGALKQKTYERRLEEYQSKTSNNYIKGDFVKTRVEICEGFYEHMWVKVTKVNKKSISGVLDNDPFNPNSEIKCGDKINVPFDKIWDYLP